MKLPSLTVLISTTLATFKRFYTAIAFAILASIFCIMLIHLKSSQDYRHQYFVNIIMSSYLGMLLSLSVTAFSERQKLNKTIKIGLQFIAVALTLIYYFSLSDQFKVAHLLRFFLYVTGLHLLIAFAPFTVKGETNGFWQYNRILFLRFLATLLYAAVLYLGLSLALLAVEKLFKVNIDNDFYGDLWILIAGIFSTCFFLAGFPEEYEKLEMKTEYPRGLKIFTQYILLPIITIYLLILYAYMFKILFNFQWPFGWVSYLVLALSIAGILSLLLIHPERLSENNKWILIYSRFFYLALCPLIVLLFLAIERRINDYGITEPRYFVLALSFWLAAIVLYFLLSKRKNIKIIPVSLCCLAFFSSFGPWGAFSVALHSQQKKLIRVLEKNNLLDQQKFRPTKTRLPEADAYRINSIIEYLVENHGYGVLQPVFSQNLDSLMKSDRNLYRGTAYTQSAKIEALMHIEYSGSGFKSDNQNAFNFSTDQNQEVIRLTGYEYLIGGFTLDLNYQPDSVIKHYVLGNKTLLIQFDRVSNKLIAEMKNEAPATLEIYPLIKSFKDKVYTNFTQIDPEEMSKVVENKDILIKFMFSNISGDYNEKNLTIERLTADILVRFKESPGN